MKKKFAFIVPYFGKFHSWFQLWLDSCARNEMVDWIIFTDDKTPYTYPDNVIVHYCTFGDIKHLIQKNYSFPISLDFPFKLCDFRPAYGEIFSNYLKDYLFWGYCDTDLIWGDLSRWLRRDDICEYDRISHWGHCSLFHNSAKINAVYKMKVDNVKYYKDVFSKARHCAFDEEPGFNVLARAYGIKELVIPFFDVQPPILSYQFSGTYMTSPFFIEATYRRLFRVCQDGVLMYALNSKRALVKRDFAYVHLQRRKMQIDRNFNQNDYFIIPNKFVSSPQILTENSINELMPSRLSLIVGKQKALWKSRLKMVIKNLF